MDINSKIHLTITDMTDDGKGIGHVDGMAVFVEGAIPGDRILAEVTQVKKRYALATLQEIEEPSENRVEPECPYFEKCGGCSLQSMKNEAQLEMKRAHVINKLSRIGNLEAPLVHPVLADEQGEGYRNKATFAVVKTANGPLVGFRERGSHRVVDIEDCMMQRPAVMAVANAIRELIRSGKLPVFDERKLRGNNRGRGRNAKNNRKSGSDNMPTELREFTVKVCEGTGEMMVVLTVTGKKLNHAEDIIYAIDDAINEVTEEYSLESVVLEVKKGDIHDFAKDYAYLAGKRTITDHVEINNREFDFEISPSAFYQVNYSQMRVLYEQAAAYAQLTGEEVLFDLYCGIGTIGLSMIDKANYVVGIEEVPGAVIDANRNAVINGVVNARYYTGKAEAVLPRILEPEDSWYADYLFTEEKSARPRVVVLDPPRGGCDERLLESVVSLMPERIVYVSCDAGTLARDIKVLEGSGYRFVEATPVEMFGGSMHVETVVALRREKVDGYVDIDLEI